MVEEIKEVSEEKKKLLLTNMAYVSMYVCQG